MVSTAFTFKSLACFHSLRAAAGTAVCNLEISRADSLQAKALDRVCSRVSSLSVPAQGQNAMHVISAGQLYSRSNKIAKLLYQNRGPGRGQSNSDRNTTPNAILCVVVYGSTWAVLDTFRLASCIQLPVRPPSGLGRCTSPLLDVAIRA